MAETVTKPPLLDSTGVELLAALKTQNSLVAQLVRAQAFASEMSWDMIRSIVRAGMAPQVFSIGDQLVIPWSDGTTTYQMPADVVAFEQVELETGEVVEGMTCQFHYTLPFPTSYASRSAFYCAKEAALPAGTYNVTMGYSQGTMVEGKVYQFTLAKELPKGGQLLGFTGCWDNAASSWRVSAYASASTAEPTETVAVTEGSAGTSLGTFTRAGDDKLFSIQSAAYGLNDWELSPLRTWLNSSAAAGQWYKPTHDHDHVPCANTCWGAYDGRRGFLAGFEDDFLAVVGKVKQVTCRNYVNMGGTSAAPAKSVTYDKFYLPSLEQHHIACNESSVDGVEGSSWPYWRLVAGQASRLPLRQTYPQLITCAVNAKTSPQTVWMRSPNRGNACNAFVVNASGNVYDGSAHYGSRAAPAFTIC